MKRCVARPALFALFSFVAFSAAFNVSPAKAQAYAGAEREMAISLFAGATYLRPDFGKTQNFGYISGGDITVLSHLVDVSFEVRYSSANGTYDDQSVLAGGLKVERSFHRFRPYVDYLIGAGTIRFDHPELVGADSNYTHDNSPVYDFGGGVDYRLTHHLSIKVDAQRQSWRIGVEHPAFHPTNVSLGIVYHIPHHHLRGR